MKRLRKIFFYFLLTVSVLVIAGSLSIYFYSDRIINEFVREANKHLNTPVKVGRIEVSVLDKFPLLSIVCHNVSVEDSHPGTYPLLIAREVRFQMNPIEVWQGQYRIRGLTVIESETNLKIDADGRNNFTIVTKSKPGETGSRSVAFELRNVEVYKARVHYRDLHLNHDMVFDSDALRASISTKDDIYNIEADGDVTTEKLDIRGQSFLVQKVFDVSSDLVYNDIDKSIRINPSELKLHGSTFIVKGSYEWKDRNLINIDAEGKNTDIQTLFSLLPEGVSRRFEKYESRGDVYFSGTLKGEITANTYPAVAVDFGFSHATLFHPQYKSRIEDASLKGTYQAGDLMRASKGTLALRDITGRLNDEVFSADLVLRDFDDPDLNFRFKGNLDAQSIANFYPIDALNDLEGQLNVDIAFQGRAGLLKSKHTAQQVTTRGSVDLHGISLKYGTSRIPFSNLNGSLQFSNNDLALSNLSGKLGESDFLLNGFFKNIVTFLFFENQPVGIEADLKSRSIDLDQLLAFTFGSDSADAEPYKFSISPNVNLNFNCDLRALRYRRFRATHVKGDLLVKTQMAVSRKLSLNTMGGRLELSGIIDGKNPKAIDVVTNAHLQNIYIDSVFFVFENFNQTFIEDKHLRGQGTADVSLELVLNESLDLFPKTLIADIGITMKNGQLNNFEPIQKLDRYLDDEGLNRLRFAELHNDIHIENETIYLPQMNVRSNVSDMEISGTHTFDQRIDYRVSTPLRRKKGTDAEMMLAVEEDPLKGPRLFLKITGTTDDYRIQYDTEAVRKKISGDLKKEVQELKDAFKSRGKQKEKEIELSKDDYFDWEQ